MSRKPQMQSQVYASNDQEFVMRQLQAAQEKLQNLMQYPGEVGAAAQQCFDDVSRALESSWKIYHQITNMRNSNASELRQH